MYVRLEPGETSVITGAHLEFGQRMDTALGMHHVRLAEGADIVLIVTSCGRYNQFAAIPDFGGNKRKARL